MRKRHLKLEAESPDARRFVTGLELALAEDAKTSVVTLTRAGRFYDRRYGEFEITPQMLLAMVANFDKRTYGQDIFIDVAHRPDKGAAGKITKLAVDGDRLRAQVEWTSYGVEAIKHKGYAYLSAEFHENWTDNEKREAHGPVLLGAGLTVRPVIKRLDPVQLSEDFTAGRPTYLNPELVRSLSEEVTHIMDKWLKKLREKLQARKLAETVIEQVVAAYQSAAKNLGEDEKAHGALVGQFDELAKTLAEQIGDKPLKLEFRLPETSSASKSLSEDDVKRIISQSRQADADATKKLTETRDARVSQFNKLLSEAKGLEGLPEDARKQLSAAADLINADMTEDQVKRLAENQITLGNQMAAATKLAQMGWKGPAGSVQISVDDGNAIKALQETVDRRLGILEMSDGRRFAATGGKLLAENKAFVEHVLAEFDRAHAKELHEEAKKLAGGAGNVGDVAVPVSWERTVIREALYRLVMLGLVNVGTVTFSSAHSIPYSYRDTTAAGRNNTRKYEGQGIQRAGVVQTAETVYQIPQKLAFEVSDELRYLTGARHIDWETVAENTQNAVRIISEDTEQLLANEHLQASDEFSAIAVSNEAVAGVNGTNRVFLLASFPVARPRRVFDMQGNQVGATSNPITVTYSGTVRQEFDGSGTQAAGTYYVLNYNLGEIYLVDQTGAVITPPNATAFTVSYSRVTNTFAFNTDPGAVEVGVHWDNFLYRYGLRKTVIEDDRYHRATMGLMSGTAMTQIEQARQFTAGFLRRGTDLQTDGNLGRIKDVPNYKVIAPGLWAGDQRILIGERGVTRFRMARPWQLGELENQRDANGRFTGKKEAYGDQFVVVHTPTMLKRAYTSITLYSAAARVARVNP